jgi:hypothetical protein
MPTFFGVTSIPTDNGTNATTTITLTPPASMVANDLVIVYGYQRGTATISVGITGGQTWTPLVSSAATNISTRLFYATYNGTWDANPRFDFSAGTNTSAVMIVFRPSNSSNVLSYETFGSQENAAAATITVASTTPGFDNNVTLAIWTTADDNTWGTLTGTNWVKTGLAAQYRNLAGNDMSSTFAYQLQTTKAATNSVSQTQLTVGNDLTLTSFVTFYETQAFTGGFDPFGQQGIFGL